MSERRSDELPGSPVSSDPGESSESGAWGASDRVLGLWPSASPPDGFVGDVLDAAAVDARMRRERRRTRRMAAAGVVALAAAGAIVLLVRAMVGDRPEVALGARFTERRETLQIGSRAVAVAEPSTALVWRVAEGVAAVEQSGGGVFYRVDRGAAPFTVGTSTGRVIVLGTCFRVDVTRDAMTVAVYEGSVTAENERGRVHVVAGERAVLAPDRPPTTGPIPVIAAADVVLPPAPAGATATERARDEAFRGQIVALRQRVTELETSLAAMPKPAQPGRPPDDKYDGFTHDELLWMAQKCEVRYDLPGYAYAFGRRVGQATAARLGLSDAERDAIDRINQQGDSKLLEQTKDLYVELTGDRDVAEALEPRTLQHEIMLKSRPGDEERALQRVSAERAGIVQPPSDLSRRPAVERLLRLMVAVGDQYEERLAAAVGAKRAAELRHSHAGMGVRSGAGCPEN